MISDTEYNNTLAVLDQAMSSDDPRIRDAMQRLLVTSALLDQSQSQNQRMGPFQDLIRQNNELRRRISELENEFTGLKNHLAQVRMVPSMPDFSNITSIDISSITGINGITGTPGRP